MKTMIEVNLDLIGDFPEDMMLAKQAIEKCLIEDGKIESRMPLADFIAWLKLEDCIYLDIPKNAVVPLAYVKTPNEDYLFTSYSHTSTEATEAYKVARDIIIKTEGDLSSRTKLDQLEVGMNGVDKFFIIRQREYYV